MITVAYFIIRAAKTSNDERGVAMARHLLHQFDGGMHFVAFAYYTSTEFFIVFIPGSENTAKEMIAFEQLLVAKGIFNQVRYG